MNSDDDQPQGALTLSRLFAQVFSERSLISAASYCAYNAFAGLLLLGLSIVAWQGDHGNARADAVILAMVGLALGSGLIVALRWPRAVERALAGAGALLLSLALWFTGRTVEWSLVAPPLASFRYLPGLGCVLSTYGALQLATFGPWSGHASRLRKAGLLAGIILELVAAAALLTRFFRA